MRSQRKFFAKPLKWNDEAKTPPLVSLSARDQNILRPPRRSSSLKMAAKELKKSLSSHHSTSISVKENIQALRRGKHSSCSTLQVGKKGIRTDWRSQAADRNRKVPSHRCSDDTEFSEATFSELFEPQVGDIRCNAHPRRQQLARDFESVSSASTRTETIVCDNRSDDSKSSCALSSDVDQPKNRDRQHSAKRLFSKMMESIQIKSQDVTVPHWTDNSIEICNRNTSSLAVPFIGIDFDRRLGHSAEIAANSSVHKAGKCQVTESIEQVDTGRDFARDNMIPYQLQIYAGHNEAPPMQLRETSSASSSCFEGEHTPCLRQPLRIRITTRADIQETTLASSESIWTIVQLHAELPRMNVESPPRHNSIAVAMVLDNSRLATRKDVKKACLEVMALANSFEEGVDHIGIYCTSGANLADTCLLPLSSLNLELLQRRLEEVPDRSRNSYRVQDAFLQAAQALRTLQMQSHLGTPRIKEDIVIITSSDMGLSSCFQQDLTDFRIHLVNPSLIPYSNKVLRQLFATRKTQSQIVGGTKDMKTESIKNCFGLSSGWLLDAARCISEDCEEHGSHSLIDALEHSRSRADAGSITNVSISIHEREEAIIEDIIGDLFHPILLPGQITSIPIKIRLNSLVSRLSIGSVSDIRSSSRLSMADAISELELSLGNHLSELFEVQVSYNHSFFPNNTCLETRESCWLPRHPLPRRTGTLRGNEIEESIQPFRYCRVQKQLALCMAATSAPTQALSDLESITPQILSESAVHFLDALKRRLRHRIALFADVSFMDYLLASEYAVQAAVTYEEQESYGDYLGEYDEAYSLQEDSDPATPSTIVRRRPRKVTSSNEEEEARRIWQHIRRTSRPGEPPKLDGGDSDQESEYHSRHIEEIRTTALKHGRRISTATLRSLAKEFRHNSGLTEERREQHEPGN